MHVHRTSAACSMTHPERLLNRPETSPRFPSLRQGQNLVTSRTPLRRNGQLHGSPRRPYGIAAPGKRDEPTVERMDDAQSAKHAPRYDAQPHPNPSHGRRTPGSSCLVMGSPVTAPFPQATHTCLRAQCCGAFAASLSHILLRGVFRGTRRRLRSPQPSVLG